MKTGRLIAYAITGIIAGLFIENSALRFRQKASRKARAVKRRLAARH